MYYLNSKIKINLELKLNLKKYKKLYIDKLKYIKNLIICNNNINICKLFMIVMSSRNTNNNQSILEGLIRAMPQLTERNQLM